MYSEIVAEECKALSEADLIVVEIKKKVNAEWIRLLSSLVKLRFIKSEYNNLDISSDDNDGSVASGDSTQRRQKSKIIYKLIFLLICLKQKIIYLRKK